MSITRPARARARVFRVLLLSAAATRGRLVGPGIDVPCAVGRSGVSSRKREGDGSTPAGLWPLRMVIVRRDRVCGPNTRVPLRTMQRNDGWCDDPDDRNYNRAVKHPYPASAEVMWREDALYDLVGVLGHNDRPRIHSRGSAVFLHVARADYAPTAGCIALARRDLLRLLGVVRVGSILQTDRSARRLCKRP